MHSWVTKDKLKPITSVSSQKRHSMSDAMLHLAQRLWVTASVTANHRTTSPRMFSIFYYESGLLFWFECFLISAPTFVCHSSLRWKSTDCNHLTVSHKSPSQRSTASLSYAEQRAIHIRPLYHREEQAKSITLSPVTPASRGAILNTDYESGGKPDPNIDLCFTFIKFQSKPISSSRTSVVDMVAV